MIPSARALLSAAILTLTIPVLAQTATHHKPVAHPPAHTTSHSTAHTSHSTAHTSHSTAHTSRTTAHTSRTSSHTTAHGAHISRTSYHGKSHAASHHLPVVAMTTERATQIQSALIKQGYLTGEPTGNWDAASISAMQKLQGDNGWQTKIMPDSRALIKLGLGPNNQGPSE